MNRQRRFTFVWHASRRLGLVIGLAALVGACGDDSDRDEPLEIAEGIYAPLGEVVPFATDEQRATFDRGRELSLHRFGPDEGLGPEFNVTFCAGCHEKPVFGGSAGRYRDFYLGGTELSDGTFIEGELGGIVTSFGIGDAPTRPAIDDAYNVIARRNPIPFFGVGLIAELPESSILANVDEEDADGDGISGRANWDGEFVGRFGRKAQTVSIEGFIRGPLNNHLGITTDPLTPEQRDALPVPSGTDPRLAEFGLRAVAGALRTVGQAQAAPPSEPLFDDDDIADPELSTDELFDIVSFAMLLAPPEPGPVTEASLRGEALFEDIGCASCHVPALDGPRGALPLYSDLLLHDMGHEMDDGLEQGVATGSEFRTQPLWGVAVVGPYLHDGRADTLDEAIRWHGGEGQASRDRYVALAPAEQGDVIAFLESLGGMDQYTAGLLPPDEPVPAIGEMGGPARELTDAEMDTFIAGRELFDRDFHVSEGIGTIFNGDSCRACHFEPVIGGAGPIGVNVMRFGTWADDGFEMPGGGTILQRFANPGYLRPEHDSGHNFFEMRQTPNLLGIGRIETVSDETILANADPDDADGDGIRGVPHMFEDGRLGRYGWKAQVPSIREFVRDAMSVELGMSVPAEDGLTFGFQMDDDDVADPEIDARTIDTLEFWLALASPPTPAMSDPEGRALFEEVGCASCHVPSLDGSEGPVPLYSNLLLHDVAPDDYVGVPDGEAGPRMFRTPPLWGLRHTGPYMHNGLAATVGDAIDAHHGEATASREAVEALDDDDYAALIRFLESL